MTKLQEGMLSTFVLCWRFSKLWDSWGICVSSRHRDMPTFPGFLQFYFILWWTVVMFCEIRFSAVQTLPLSTFILSSRFLDDISCVFFLTQRSLFFYFFSLRLLYSLLFSGHIKHFQVLDFLPFPYSFHVHSPLSVWLMSNNITAFVLGL
jgi:hypothetical protein